MNRKIIAHIDMDAFFAAVEEREKPWLRGLPIAVGADPQGGEGRGVVSTANYAARAYGIHSALPISKAWRYSQEAKAKGLPEVIFITPTFGKYGDASKEVMALVRSYSDTVQVTSVDEAYFDMSQELLWEAARLRAQALKDEIKEKTQLTCSIGIGSNKLIAKIASDFEKPDGLTLVSPDSVKSFLAPLPLKSIPGIGSKTTQRFLLLGMTTVADVQRCAEEELKGMFGKWGSTIHEKVHGKGSTELSAERPASKSIGEHDTFHEDTVDFNIITKRLRRIAEDLIQRLHKQGFSAYRTVVLTVRYADFDTKTRSLSTPDYAYTQQALESRALKLAMPFFDKRENPKHKSIRMIGLRLEKLR